jgi:HlyD family secretion protein
MTTERTRKSGRTLFWGALALALAAAVGWSFMPRPVAVDLAAVTEGAMTVNVESEGRTRVKDMYVISAPAAGRLMRIDAEAGDEVLAGVTRLAVIEPADPTILDRRSRAEAEATAQAAADALTLASADVDRAKAELSFARSELDRARKLSKNGNISARDLDLAKLEVATKQARLRSVEAQAQVRRHELETARARLLAPNGNGQGWECCVDVTAPADGRVLRVLHKSEGVVAAGTPLIEIGNPGRLEVVVDLLTTDAAKVREGAPVSIKNWGGPALEGRLNRIEPFGYTKTSVLGIDEQRVDVIVDFADPDTLPRALGHGFRVEVEIVEWQADKVLKAPMAALFRLGDEWAAYVDEAGTARLTPLRIGHQNGREAEVLSGLEAGDRVVLHPSDAINDGRALTVRGD